MSRPTMDRTRPAGILRLANSFCDAKALLTAVELGLFTALRAGPASTADICERLRLHGRGLSDWLELLTELELLERVDGQYRNSPGTEIYLVRGQDSYIGGFLERSNRNLYPAWGRLTEALRTGKPQSGSSFDTVIEDARILEQFINSMDALTRILGPQLIETYGEWESHRSVLDLGGCRGSLVSQIVAANPHMSGAAFDLPQMAPFFDSNVAARSLTGKVSFHAGNFFTDPLPSADVVIMGHVLHDWDREQQKFLVEKVFHSVNPGGTLLVYDRMLDRESSRIENLVISLDMLLVTDGGSEYTVAEMREHAEGAGFSKIEDRPLGDADTLVVARKLAEVTEHVVAEPITQCLV